MATKMIRWLSNGSTDLVREEVDVPDTPEHGYLVKVAYTGVCGGDLLFHGLATPEAPKVLGHEVAGYVHKIGSQVPEAGRLSVGDRVLVYAWAGCLQCRACDNSYCPRRWSEHSNEIGLFKHGGYQEYIAIPDPRLLHKIPTALSMDMACTLACGGLTTYNAVCTIKREMQSVLENLDRASLLIIGPGGLGLWAVRWAKLLLPDNVKIVIAGRDPLKLEEAKKAGAHESVLWGKDLSESDITARTKEVCEGGVDGCIDLVNNTSSVTRFIETANFGATCLLIGTMGGELPQIKLDTFPLKCPTLKGLCVGTIPQQARMIQIAAENQMSSPPITLYKQSELNAVFDKLRKREIVGRAVIQYDCPEYQNF